MKENKNILGRFYISNTYAAIMYYFQIWTMQYANDRVYYILCTMDCYLVSKNTLLKYYNLSVLQYQVCI